MFEVGLITQLDTSTCDRHHLLPCRFMDATIKDLLSKLGIEAGKQAIQAVIRQWEERKQRKVDTAK